MSTTNTPSFNNANTSPRRVGLTEEQGLAQQQRILSETYVIDNPSHEEREASPPPVSPKSMPAPPTKGKGKGTQRTSAAQGSTAGAETTTDGTTDAPASAHKLKPKVTKPDMGMTPTRRSPRDRTKKRTLDDVEEPESPLAKKGRKGKGKATMEPDDDAALSETRHTSLMKQTRAQVPKDHTPFAELAAKKAGGKKTGGRKRAPAASSKADAATETVTETNVDEEDVVDDNADEELTGKKTTKSRKGKGKASDAMEGAESTAKNNIIPKDFVGHNTDLGTSSNKPIGAKAPLLKEPWPCANRHCTTGMTWLERDAPGQAGFGRKSVSHFFGRNKAATNYIKNSVWHTFCRKCYQTGLYGYKDQTNPTDKFFGKALEGAAAWHIKNVRSQFVRLKLWRPEAVFRVQLSKGMHERSHAYHALIRTNNNDVVAAQAAYKQKYPIKPRKATNKKSKSKEVSIPKPEEAFPVELVDSFTNDCCGENFDYDRIDEVLDQIQAVMDADTIKSLPPIEFLISKAEDGETVSNPKHNYQRWLAFEDKRDFATPRSSDDEPEDDEESNGVEGAPTTPEEKAAGSHLLDHHFGDSVDAGESNGELQSDTESECEDDDVDEAGPSSRFTPVNNKAQQKMNPYKLTPINKPNSPMLTPAFPGAKPLSSTFGAQKGSGLRSERERRERSGSELPSEGKPMYTLGGDKKRARDSDDDDEDAVARLLGKKRPRK